MEFVIIIKIWDLIGERFLHLSVDNFKIFAMTDIIFESWSKTLEVVVLTIISFVTLFVFIRISGKRTLAKFNAFDFVVTVTLGSVLAYMMLGQVNLAEGSVVLFIIIAMQLLFAKLSRKSHVMDKLLNASPKLLFYQGLYLHDNMEKEMVSKDEIVSAIRQRGLADISKVLAVVIEPNGEMSIIEGSKDGGSSTLDHLEKAVQDAS